MDYITINTKSIPYPNGFQMEPYINKVAVITTESGNEIGDKNGYKYKPQTFSWDTLLDADLQNLLTAISDDEFEITFLDIDGTTKTVRAEKESRLAVKTRYISDNGSVVWKNVSVSLSFPICYHE